MAARLNDFRRAGIGAVFLMALAGLTSAAAAAPGDRPPPVGLSGPIVGSIEISNERDRPVAIYIDGRFALEVGARRTEVISAVPNGIRLVSYAGAGHGEGLRWQTDRVEVRENRRAALRIAPLRGRVAIFNGARTEMRVSIDGTELGRVMPGREIMSPPIRAGRHQLTAHPIGWDRTPPQVQEIVIAPGEVTRAEVRAMAATLVISNPFRRRTAAFVDGRHVADLDRLESQRITGLRPGRVSVELRHRRRVLASEVTELVAGRETYFAPQLLRSGALELNNGTQEPVRITLVEQPGGARLPQHMADGFRLDPGAARVVDDIEAGALVVQVTTRDGRIIKHETEIIAGRTARFDVPYAWLGEPAPRPRRR